MLSNRMTESTFASNRAGSPIFSISKRKDKENVNVYGTGKATAFKQIKEGVPTKLTSSSKQNLFSGASSTVVRTPKVAQATFQPEILVDYKNNGLRQHHISDLSSHYKKSDQDDDEEVIDDVRTPLKQKVAENKYFSLTSIINMNSNASNRLNFIRSSYDDSSKDFSLISVSGLGIQTAGDKMMMTSDCKQLPSLNYSMTQSKHD